MSPVNPYAPPEFESPGKRDKKYERIGGWLILVAIGLVLSMIANVIGVLGIAMLLSTGDETLTPTYLVYGFLECTVLIVAAIVALMLMFRRSAVFPKYMICMLTAGLVLSLISTAIAGPDQEEVQSVLRAIISCAIWIPYFLRSKRVEKTFVN